MRDVDELRNSAFLCDMGDRFGTGDVHGIEIEVPRELGLAFVTKGRRSRILGFVFPPDKVVHYVRMSYALFSLLFVPHVPFLPNVKG
jgi:hypothetical protein